MASYPLIGTWKLLSWENRSVEEDGRISYPLDEDATGYIMYNQDGNMFVAIMSPYRLSSQVEIFSAGPQRKKHKPRRPSSPIAAVTSCAKTE